MEMIVAHREIWTINGSIHSDGNVNIVRRWLDEAWIDFYTASYMPSPSCHL